MTLPSARGHGIGAFAADVILLFGLAALAGPGCSRTALDSGTPAPDCGALDPCQPVGPATGAGAGGSSTSSGGTTSGGSGSGNGGSGGCIPGCATAEIVSVAAGEAYTCALSPDGSVRCWGANGHGAAGYGKGLCDAPPIPCTNACCIGDDETPASAGEVVDVGGRVIQLSAGVHTCAVLDTGSVRCWGHGSNGNLGYASTEHIGDDETPASAGDVDVGASVVQVVAGGNQGGAHTCALTTAGTVRCWGYGPAGSLGYANTQTIGDDEPPAVAGDVDVGGKVIQVVAGESYTCALLETGRVRCWGAGARGRLGYANTNTIGDDETPASAGDVDIGGTVTQLAAGGRHTCALLDTARVRCWGYGADGALGYGNTEDIGDDETPASTGDVDVGAPVIALSAGKHHTCAVLDTGALKCWGDSYHGELGLPELMNQCGSCNTDPSCCIGDDEAPSAAGNTSVGGSVVQVSATRFHTCAVLSTGKVRCWGGGSYGALGYGNTNTIGDDEPPSAAGDVPLF